jgi:hypothetical protein
MMTEFLCTTCMTWSHQAPECNHDPQRRCIVCNKPVGYRFMLDDGRASSPFKCAPCQR